jgi:hypothetical protein
VRHACSVIRRGERLPARLARGRQASVDRRPRAGAD